MDKQVYVLGDEVNAAIVRAQGALAAYNHYSGNRAGMAKQADIDRLRDMLADAEYLSRVLAATWMMGE